MEHKTRYLAKYIKRDLTDKMVLLAGPRQVGKTSTGFALLNQANETHPAYFSWDIPERRRDILDFKLPIDQSLIILDEIHKYRDWRELLKGLYDGHKTSYRFLVTGSARLDEYSKGGDTLQGRYFLHRLHPFSLSEISKTPTAADLDQLLTLGGFPEPLLRGDLRFWRRWQKERRRIIFKEEVVSLERVQELNLLELLADALPEKIGSPLSLQSLREDLQVAHDTVARWLLILERLFVCFRISPFGPPKIRAVKKEQKLYLYDWSLCKEPGARFENLVASQLLKYCHFLEDTEGYNMELRYLRDIDKREVDFVVLRDKKPQFAVECKLSDTELSPHIKYFAERTEIPQFYQVHNAAKEYEQKAYQAQVLAFTTFVKKLELP